MLVLAKTIIVGSLMVGSLHGDITFVSYGATMAVKGTNSKIILDNSDKVTGWSEFSIVKKTGKETASQWAENYYDTVVISQEGSEEPSTQLIISNSNAINYGIKNNSNALLQYDNSANSPFTLVEKWALLEDVRTDSHAFVYCCKNTSNALNYGLKNNSSAIVRLHAWAFSVPEKEEFLDYVRTTSNGLLSCCKNTSNTFAYGLKNNSNAVVRERLGAFLEDEKEAFLQTLRTTSNAFLYCCKNTSNALVFGLKNNSNALVNWPGGALWSIFEKEELYETIRVNSNAFVYCCKNSSNAIAVLANALKVYETHKIYTDDAIEQNFVLFKDGFTVPVDKALTLDTSVPVNGLINLNDTGILQLRHDMYLNSDAYLSNGGVIKGSGKALVLSCNFTIPENQVLRISEDTIINGHGTTITLEPHARIIVDNNVTLTIENACIKNTQNTISDPMISIAGSAGKLALQNCELALADDYYVTNGHLFIHDDVIISGTSSLVYTSPQHSYIADASTLCFDQCTRFFYNPSVSNNALIQMQSATSCLFFDGSILEAGDMGIRLSKGMLCLDNSVTLSCPISTMIIFGDSSVSDGDLDVCVQAHVEIAGVVYDDSSFDTP